MWTKRKRLWLLRPKISTPRAKSTSTVAKKKWCIRHGSQKALHFRPFFRCGHLKRGSRQESCPDFYRGRYGGGEGSCLSARNGGRPGGGGEGSERAAGYDA